MITWTHSADAALSQHNQSTRGQLMASGADPDEVAADLRRHVEEELSAGGIHVVTKDDVHRVLARLGVLGASLPARVPARIPRRKGAIALGAALVLALSATWAVHHLRGRADPSAATDFPYSVPFEVGTATFLPGDLIVIDQVSGTAPTLYPGQRYCVTGHYTLGSADEADLACFLTSLSAATGRTPTFPEQHIRVHRGSGSFRLIKTMEQDGYLHVSFYPSKGGRVLGGVYFGQGDRVQRLAVAESH